MVACVWVMRIWRRSTKTPKLGPRSTFTSGLLAALLCVFSACWMPLPAATVSAKEGAPDDRASLISERNRLQAENAALDARLSLIKDSGTYLVADLTMRRLQLELQGVALASVPIEAVRLNRHAERLLFGGERSSLLATPFVLAED